MAGNNSMDHKKLYHYVLIGLFLGLLYLAFLVIRPYLTYLVLALILSYLLHPVYKHLARKFGRKELASILLILLVLVVIILPSVFLVNTLVKQSVSAYNTFTDLEVSNPEFIDNLLHQFGWDPDLALQRIAKEVKDFVVINAPNIIGGIASVSLGLFIMFFFMYYAFLDGDRWMQLLRENLPLEPEHRERLFNRMGSITSAVVYGQFLTAVIQGSLGGLMFLVFGIPNPIFWGVIMIILSFLPFLGTPLIWAPAGIIEIIQGNYVSGIGILVIGLIVVMNVDNIIRPYLISSRDKLNPVLVLLGVLGGLHLFGFIGILLGPLLLALLQTVIELFRERPPKHVEKKEPKKKSKLKKTLSSLLPTRYRT